MKIARTDLFEKHAQILGAAAAESLSIWHNRQYWNINACTAHDTTLWWLLEKADPLLDVFIKFPSKENTYWRMIKLNNDGKGHFSSLLSYTELRMRFIHK